MESFAILLLILSGTVFVALLLLRGRKGALPETRSLPGFQRLPAESGYAAESGGAVHVALGSGGLGGEDTVTSLAGLQVVDALARAGVTYSAPPIITVGDPTLLPLAQDILRRAYEHSGRAELYDPGQVRFIAPSPVAYAAGAAYAVATENVTANTATGAFGGEVALVTEAADRNALPQAAAATDPRALGALYPTTKQLAAGEELFAAGAQLTGERRYLIGLLAQDILRAILALIILGAAGIAFFAGWGGR
jgi:hypothetical protein